MSAWRASYQLLESPSIGFSTRWRQGGRARGAAGRLPGSGVDVEQRYGIVYTVESGQISPWRGFCDHEEALEAVGLRE